MRLFQNLESVLTQTGLRKNDCHPELPRDKEFHGIGLGGGAISLEEALFIAGVIATVKPDIVIELGTAQGGSTVCIGAILKDFGKGKLITVDMAESGPPMPAHSIQLEHFLPVKWIRNTKSMDFLANYDIEEGKRYLVFSDTDIPIRPDEVNYVRTNFPEDTYILVHDTSSKHPFGPMELEKKTDLEMVQLPSPRGITLVSAKDTER